MHTQVQFTEVGRLIKLTRLNGCNQLTGKGSISENLKMVDQFTTKHFDDFMHTVGSIPTQIASLVNLTELYFTATN